MASGDASDPAHGGSARGWLPIRSSRRGHSVGGSLAASLGDVGQGKGSDEESACPSFFSEEQPTPGSWGATNAPLWPRPWGQRVGWTPIPADPAARGTCQSGQRAGTRKLGAQFLSVLGATSSPGDASNPRPWGTPHSVYDGCRNAIS